MIFKVSKGHELYNQLTALMDRVNDCDNKAKALAKELGGTDCRGAYFCIGGGLSAISIPGVKPKGWKVAHRNLRAEYMPSSIPANKEINKRISDLPVVTYNELNSLVGYRSDWGHPGIEVKGDNVFLTFGEKQYQYLTPVQGMVEITHTEYKQLVSE